MADIKPLTSTFLESLSSINWCLFRTEEICHKLLFLTFNLWISYLPLFFLIWLSRTNALINIQHVQVVKYCIYIYVCLENLFLIKTRYTYLRSVVLRQRQHMSLAQLTIGKCVIEGMSLCWKLIINTAIAIIKPSLHSLLNNFDLKRQFSSEHPWTTEQTIMRLC